MTWRLLHPTLQYNLRLKSLNTLKNINCNTAHNYIIRNYIIQINKFVQQEEILQLEYF